MSSLPQGRGIERPFRLVLVCLLGALLLVLLAGGPSAEAKTKCTQRGTKGIDILKGTKHRDVLCGLGGDDILLGKKGKDTLKGGGGKDVLLGGDGADKLIAGGGADSLTGGKGSDTIKGQGGSDTAAFTDAPGAMTVDLHARTAKGIGSDKLSGIDNVIGSPANDTITGNGGANKITAGSGDDMIIGGGGDDTLSGESGIDTVSYAASPAGVTGGLDSGSMSGEGNDTVSGVEKVIGSSHDDTIVGGNDNDTISGGDGEDHLSGGGGDDLINGDAGNDQIFGEDANDSLHGDDGDDLIDGGGGVNACDGGAGANTFAGNCDTGPPQLSDVRVNPASINTFNSSQTVVFRIDASDDLAGVDPETSKVVVHFPTGSTKTVPLTRISGTESAGTFGADLDVPRYAPTGTYTFDIVLTDNSGNSKTITSAELISASHPGSFEQTGEGDSEAPEVTALTMTPATVDSSGADVNLHFVIHATDNLAGVDPSKSGISIVGPAGNELYFSSLSSAGGTPTSGDFTVDLTLPRYSPRGTYKIDLGLVDQAGNLVFIPSQQLISNGLTGSFQQVGIGDTAPPALTAFTRSPATTDTRESAQTVTVNLTATDDLSGIDLLNSVVVIRDPNGRIDSTTSIVSKGSNNYSASPILARGSVPGIWKIDVILYDKAGNLIEYPSNRLSQLGFQSTFQNLAVQGT